MGRGDGTNSFEAARRDQSRSQIGPSQVSNPSDSHSPQSHNVPTEIILFTLDELHRITRTHPKPILEKIHEKG